ncbi:MAG: tRNA 2-thiouridine(34) synthase MnmA, partial [Candidatus Eremiobacteraeota bacterium]|nr:tRNA 2-thiouridine(34) synthase MnmA [Candidatus Eremiobacteraeota bacterium]
SIKVSARPRYKAPVIPAEIFPEDEKHLKVEFEIPQRALTPGQSVVFYQGNLLLGGGVITGIYE